MQKNYECQNSKVDLRKPVQTSFNEGFAKPEYSEQVVTHLNDVSNMDTTCSRNGFDGSDSRSKGASNSKGIPDRKKKRKRGSPCLFENCRKYKKLYVNFESHLERVHRIKLQEYGEMFRKDVDKALLKSQESVVKKRKMSKTTCYKKCGEKIQVLNGLRDVNKLRDRKRDNDKQSRLRDNQNDVIGISQELRDKQKSLGNKKNDNENNIITEEVLFTVREDPVTQELDYEIIKKEFSSHLRKFTYDLVQLTEEERFLVEKSGTNLETLRQLQHNKLQKKS